MSLIIKLTLTAILICRSIIKKSLTPRALVAAIITAIGHIYHPWLTPFGLLVVFFLLGSKATEYKRGIKSKLVKSNSTYSTYSRKARQVFANSGVATILTVIHAHHIRQQVKYNSLNVCYNGFNRSNDVWMVGIISNYACVTADTLSSELGILSPWPPRLITRPWKTLPPGVNGAISLYGLAMGLIGSFVISTVASILLPFCETPSSEQRLWFVVGFTVIGLCGSLLDSVLGAIFQLSVVKVINGKSLTYENFHDDHTTISQPHTISLGWNILSNDGVNFLMALIMTFGSMFLTALHWKVSPKFFLGTFPFYHSSSLDNTL